jgi:hypothetical protein
MTPTELRDQAIAVAERDPPAALKLAREIHAPWFRAQALAYVARYEVEDRSLSTAMEALGAAAEADDMYKALAVTAWPIRAMLERGHHETARCELNRLLELTPRIEPESSRSEALFYLYQATFPMGDDVRECIARALVALANKEDAHWRTKRNVIEALAMLATTSPALEASLATELTNDKACAKLARRLDGPWKITPRDFFWSHRQTSAFSEPCR